MANVIKKAGFPFFFDPSACIRCQGNCCTGASGFIWVNKEEREALAIFLGITVQECMSTYVIKVQHRYSLIEVKKGRKSFDCIFFDRQKKECSIYTVRPKQCRTFPFWSHFKYAIDEIMQECPGIGSSP